MKSKVDRSEESLMAEASKITGLTDWGAEGFRTPLKVLLESYKNDAKLHINGWKMIYGKLIKNLCNRLLIQEELKRHPEIIEERIHKPLYIIGMPRTGTTLLYELLSEDPANRTLLFWEALSPAPPTEQRTYESDPRIKEAEENLRRLYEAAPHFAEMHMFRAKGPQECYPLFENTFMFPTFYVFDHLAQYSEWLKGQDMLPAYLYYRMQLQLLQLTYPTDRWLLKGPQHMHYINELKTVLPDACLIQTHRDPLKVIPSFCSVMATVRKINTDHVDLALVGEECLREMKTITERSRKARDSLDSTRFLDVYYRDLMQDPMGTVRRIYEYFGYKWNSSFEERVRHRLAENPKYKYGIHHYSIKKFGLDKDTIARQFSIYYEQFQVPLE